MFSAKEINVCNTLEVKKCEPAYSIEFEWDQ